MVDFEKLFEAYDRRKAESAIKAREAAEQRTERKKAFVHLVNFSAKPVATPIILLAKQHGLVIRFNDQLEHTAPFYALILERADGVAGLHENPPSWKISASEDFSEIIYTSEYDILAADDFGLDAKKKNSEPLEAVTKESIEESIGCWVKAVLEYLPVSATS